MILNQEQLQDRAREFALMHSLRPSRYLNRRLRFSFRSDIASLHSFAKELVNNRASCFQPAEDWLLSHIGFIEVQAQDVLRQLTKAALRQLPTMQDSGLPRIYAICDDYLEHVDGRYDVSSFRTYVTSYQEVSVLKVAECWTLPLAMRIVIIRRLACLMDEVRYRHGVCHSIASLLQRLSVKEMTDEAIRGILDRETKGRPLNATEIVHLVRHLGEHQADIGMIWHWLSAHIENSKSSLETLVSFEHQLQSELQITCGNLVQSLHRLERQPWRLTFIKVCQVEQSLLSTSSGEDLAQEYARLDFESRDLIRNRIVDISRQLNIPEMLIVQTITKLAASCRTSTSSEEHAENSEVSPRSGYIAHYLLDPHGVIALRAALYDATRPRFLPKIRLRCRPMLTYLSSAVILFAALLIATSLWTSFGAASTPLSWIAVIVALAIPVSEWAVAILHASIQRCCLPHPLLRYDFSEGLPEEARTMVVMPILWSNLEEVDDVVDRLLVHYLANRQDNIHFAILADYTDSATETHETDKQILAHAQHRISELRSQYGTDKFFLFHRSRQRNLMDDIYMGWERKRGKLVEFVELLSGKATTSFATVEGQLDILSEIRYVFTVDHDTKLPMGTVGRMAGTIHYPYNRPRLNQTETRVVEGFGVLQPRLGASYDSTQKSRFAAMWAGEPGIDPYAFAVSDPYQDLFGRAIFVGKGIFSVEAFSKVVVDRIPDNQILSHDLLEGGFLRAGLTADIEVVEDNPSTFYAYQKRAHRWIRGDWQLTPWLGRTCRNRNGDRQRNDLCGLTRWQIVDNLRRSLVPPVSFVLALLGPLTLPGRAWTFEAVVLITSFFPFLRTILQSVAGQGSMRSIKISFLQSAFQFITLPFSAVLTVDAMFRTLYRMFVSRRKLLEWETAAYVDRIHENRRVFVDERATYVVIVLFGLITWGFGGHAGRVIAVVGVLVWAFARPIVQWVNRPHLSHKASWVEAMQLELLKLAQAIWSFYERYVTSEESWLPPDNVQFDPEETIAHRTSPTNIGLYMACVIAAADLEFIDGAAMMRRLEATVKTLAGMEKWHGHLYNWYDTRSAKPLTPLYISTVDSGNLVAYLIVVRQGLEVWRSSHSLWESRIARLMKEIDHLIEQTDFRLLYNPDERLFSLGYHVDRDCKDTILYDLLASESRQASFVAIALGQVPVSHWFIMARTMTRAGGYKTLLSWSGTMFEYLMPSLIMRAYRNSLWDLTYRGVVRRQQEYADMHQVPFGISESGYYAFDYQLNYQYRAFGVPGLGLDRGLDRNLVVAPYAAIMALRYAGEQGMAALQQFERIGARGEYGFYEAVDFTIPRLPAGSRFKIIQSFMAHHQGMSMLSLANLLLQNRMVDRFHADLRVRATDLLLQERVSAKAALLKEPIGSDPAMPKFDGPSGAAERTFTVRTAIPEVGVLSNGHMISVLTNNGNGMLAWNGFSVTRWQEDPVIDTSGIIVYFHEVDTEDTWSATRYPCDCPADAKTVFRLDKAVYELTYRGITSKMEVTIAPDVDAEVRRIELANHNKDAKTIEVTTFAELALASPSADRAHPSFSKLFIQTSHDDKTQCLVAKRRPRQEGEKPVWAAHSLIVCGGLAEDYEFETDRAAFIGRGYSLKHPRSIGARLRGSVGSIADPAFVMRRSVHLPPGACATILVVTGLSDTLEQAMDIMRRLRESAQIEQAFNLAWVRTQIDLRHLHLTQEQAAAAHFFAGRILLTPPLTHVRRRAIEENTLGQSALWPFGISGDAPIAIVGVYNVADLPFVTLLVRQHQYLCMLGLNVSLVVLDETKSGYLDEFMHRLREHLAAHGIGQMRHVIGVKSAELSKSKRALLYAVSRVLLRANGPSLLAQLQMDAAEFPRLSAIYPQREIAIHHRPYIRPEGEFFNGWGSFVDGGKAYQIHVQGGAYLPRPWTNVLANPHFGCILTELGTGYTWWRNSHQCKLTPWTNDPVLDPPGECLYLCDRDTHEVWTAAPKPAGGNRAYKITHGWGFTRMEQINGVITHTMEVAVPLTDPVKVMRLRVQNRSNEVRRISVTYYVAWVIGAQREMEAPFIVTEWDSEDFILLARNAYQETFRDAIGFLHVTGPNGALVSWSGDRTEFIGHGGTLEYPNSFREHALSKRTGVFSDACGAVQMAIELPALSEEAFTILLGCASSKVEVKSLVRQYSRDSAYETALAQVSRHWEQVTGQVQVRTPDRATDIMMNGWLLYQTLGCRLWARTAFYQAGGAFGFRDQLQDSLAFLHADPSITRKQILFHAAHQYLEGDVQHWWHEDTCKGTRTRFSDDLLWLPYTVSRYLEHTGDLDILMEQVPFLESEALNDGELERYEDTTPSSEQGTLLEHCLRAIEHAIKFGEHRIPLFGSGDWNDGLSHVGAKGRGESVWLGWFLLDILKRFAQLTDEILPTRVIVHYGQVASQLEQALNDYAWDGAWFRRGFTDDGQWLGSSLSKECRIDAIAQSWSVISQGTSLDRQLRAMRSFDRELVDRDLNVARLLTTAFDKTEPSPGYIQGYAPGIRENGGQYTHGVIWSVIAWALLGSRDKAFDLFSMLNPINHTRTKHEVNTFGNEPYVISADVYTAEPHQGQAGWSWYTGAASWMYQAGLEHILGIKRRGGRIYIRPCVPLEWDSFAVEYRVGRTMYSISVECVQDGHTPSLWVVDGTEMGNSDHLELVDDGELHKVFIRYAAGVTSPIE